MILTFGSEKGGVGKTTLALNAYLYLKDLPQFKKPLFIDADKQGSASNFCDYRTDMLCVQKFDNLRKPLSEFKADYDLIIVDTAGRNSPEVRSAMIETDFLIIPSRASQLDVETLYNFSQVIEDGKIYNPDLKSMIVFNSTPTNFRNKEKEEAINLLEQMDIQIDILDSFISDRKVFRDSMSQAKSIFELTNDKAKEEFKHFMDEILAKGK